MRTEDPSVPGDDLLLLVIQRANLQQLTRDRTEFADAMLRLLNAADTLRDELDACEERWIDGLAEVGFVPKRCPKCGSLFLASAVGRPREYCDRACKPVARSAPTSTA